MYLGRIVAVGITPEGKSCAMYRVSSRSFPNRECVINGETVAVIPRAGHESDLRRNPYIAYNCVRLPRNYAVVSNGSQTDPIAEKIAMGMPLRDAFTLGLLALDYEKDSLDTPRIVAAISLDGKESCLGIIRKDAVIVRSFDLEPGEVRYLSTYEKNAPACANIDTAFAAANAEEGCDYIIGKGVFADFTNAVTAASAYACGDHFELAAKIAQ